MNNLPGYVRGVLTTIEDSGYEAVLVGGCVRDILLGRVIHDWDIATSAPAERVADLFNKTVLTGARFGTVTVVTGEGNVEVTTYRSDGAYTDNRRPDSVTFVGELIEDLRRRDFTMNAMAVRLDGTSVDPFDGRGDIARRLVRCVGEAADRFSEDALRMFRALRFSAQLGFEIEEATMTAMRRCAPLCASLSAERVRDETGKILLSDRPGIVGIAVNFGLYAPRLDVPETRPFNFEILAGLPPELELRWAAFAAVLARAGLIGSPAAFLKDLRLDAKTVRSSGTGAAAALKGLGSGSLALKKQLSSLGAEAGLCAAAADEALRGGDSLSRIRAVLGSGECWSLGELAVKGEDLIERGYQSGPGLGALLKKLLGHVLEHPEDNKKEMLLRLAEEMR
jgi:tRNA nucleotidyltransferase (CCA-adding enzyme)